MFKGLIDLIGDADSARFGARACHTVLANLPRPISLNAGMAKYKVDLAMPAWFGALDKLYAQRAQVLVDSGVTKSSLVAGIQFSGFKNVVGTLWEVDDAVAKHVEAFYDHKGCVMDCTRAAWALDCATHAVKTKVPLERRMVFVHVDLNLVVHRGHAMDPQLCKTQTGSEGCVIYIKAQSAFDTGTADSFAKF
ncbi:hypothetical protein C8R48DRAFT_761287 [Suillus tomentosus]|nr:hypothetical protein C8R48DRAFT_761287 [Suillus tomentosus]